MAKCEAKVSEEEGGSSSKTDFGGQTPGGSWVVAGVVVVAAEVGRAGLGPGRAVPGVSGGAGSCGAPLTGLPFLWQVLELLKVAWKRRLIFTVGTSSTTGETDTVVWNEIHHKTEMDRNVTGHGYPDPNYLQNVLAELAAQGVTEDCLEQQ